MDLSEIDLTVEVRACHCCGTKWSADDSAGHALWQKVKVQATKEETHICGSCVNHYLEKDSHGEDIN